MCQQEFELGFYSLYRLLLKILAIISLWPIFIILLLVFEKQEILKDFSPIVFVGLGLLIPIILLLWIKPNKLKDKFLLTKSGVTGLNSGLIEWNAIKSFDWKLAPKGGGYYIKMKLNNNAVFHFTSKRSFKTEILVSFYKEFVKNKPINVNIEFTRKPHSSFVKDILKNNTH
jgi:hypothetical protein